MATIGFVSEEICITSHVELMGEVVINGGGEGLVAGESKVVSSFLGDIATRV